LFSFSQRRTSAVCSSFPSIASLIKLIVFSRLLLLVLGLVIVVPRLLVREWPPRRDLEGAPPSSGVPGVVDVVEEGGVAREGVSGTAGEGDPDGLGEAGVGEVGVIGLKTMASAAAASSTFSATFVVVGVVGLIDGEYGELASASMRSGGRRSFSMSDVRAASNEVMALLMPSAPLARAP
jgi:hypothetical protein